MSDRDETCSNSVVHIDFRTKARVEKPVQPLVGAEDTSSNPIQVTRFNPNNISRLVQEAYTVNQRIHIKMHRHFLRHDYVRQIEPTYFLMLPPLRTEDLSYLRGIQGMRMPGSYALPLSILGYDTDEYGVKFDELRSRKTLEIAAPDDTLEAFIRQEGNLQTSIDVIMVTTALPNGWFRKPVPSVVFMQGVNRIESVHPRTASMFTTVGIVYREGSAYKKHEASFAYDAKVNSL